MNRISRDEMLLQMAEIAAKRSTCMRKQVGAIIAVESRPISLGYAGSPPGHPHCQPGILCDLSKPCLRTLHAERNALDFASRYGFDVRGGSLYCTISPCSVCADKIIAAGIIRVIYRDQYRDQTPLKLLNGFGVETIWIR